MATDTQVAPAEEAAAAAPPAPEAPAEAAKKDAKATDTAKAKDPKKDAKKDAKGNDKDAKKAKKAGGDADAGAPNIAAHPRAARGVARAKGWGGLVGFVLGGYLSLPTNTIAAAGLRALLAGVVCYVAAWAGAVFVWRRLVMLEIQGREQQLASAQVAAARRELPAPTERPRARAGA
jgi:hypothetical protein